MASDVGQRLSDAAFAGDVTKLQQLLAAATPTVPGKRE
jgi:hypothetical protein